jgi:hypothetical protein
MYRTVGLLGDLCMHGSLFYTYKGYQRITFCELKLADYYFMANGYDISQETCTQQFQCPTSYSYSNNDLYALNR